MNKIFALVLICNSMIAHNNLQASDSGPHRTAPHDQLDHIDYQGHQLFMKPNDKASAKFFLDQSLIPSKHAYRNGVVIGALMGIAIPIACSAYALSSCK